MVEESTRAWNALTFEQQQEMQRHACLKLLVVVKTRDRLPEPAPEALPATYQPPISVEARHARSRGKLGRRRSGDDDHLAQNAKRPGGNLSVAHRAIGGQPETAVADTRHIAAPRLPHNQAPDLPRGLPAVACSRAPAPHKRKGYMAQKLLPRRLGERQIERCALKLGKRGLLTIPGNPAKPPEMAPRNRAERRVLRATLRPEERS
jgi:hypothetical protein